MEYVNHPKYGNVPLASDEEHSLEEITNAHWRYSSLQFFPQTAIKADTSLQNFRMCPRRIYVDIEETCTVCSRLFIFFAREQQYWFEHLKFYVDSHCRECFECRQVSKRTKSMQARYQRLRETADRTPVQDAELEDIALVLYQLGIIKDEKLLRAGK